VYSQTTSSEMLRAGETPILVRINGSPYWQTSGRTFPLVAGAEDPPPAGAKTEDPPKPKEGDGDGDDFDKPRALATIKKLRDQEKSLKDQLKELDTLKAEQKKRDDAEKSEAEKLKEQIAELERKATTAEQRLTDQRNRNALERAATKAGLADPDDVRLLDAKDFEHDTDGNLTNADELVKALLKAKPYLAAKTNGTGVPGTPRSNGTQTHEDRVDQARKELRASGQYAPLG